MADNGQSDMGRGLTMGLEVAVGIGLGALIGNWIDHRYKVSPWGVLVGAGIGFASAMYLLIKELLRSNKN